MGIILMFAGFLFFALGLTLAFSERLSKKANSAAPVILVISIVLFCSGVVINKEDDYSISGYSNIQPGTNKPNAGESSDKASGHSANENRAEQGNSGEEKVEPGTNEDGERLKGWANGLGGSFEKWKEIFGPPDQIELINNTGKASFLDRYINADFTDGKVTAFSLDLQTIESGGFKLDAAKKEVDQFIPPDSELLDGRESGKDKTYTEFYQSEIMKRDFMQTDSLGTDSEETKEDLLNTDKFNIIYHKLDNGNIYKVHVKTEAEGKSEE